MLLERLLSSLLSVRDPCLHGETSSGVCSAECSTATADLEVDHFPNPNAKFKQGGLVMITCANDYGVDSLASSEESLSES
jgi:hypothetical protein